MGALAALELVQCELRRGGEGTSARVFTALRCTRDAVHRHGEGAVYVFAGRMCR